MINYFGVRNRHGTFDQVFAVSDDGRAVEAKIDRPHWRPLAPSYKLAKYVLADPSFVELSGDDLSRALRSLGTPKNFDIRWRTEERWTGWVSVGLILAPGIPLWFVWDGIVGWSSGYGEILAAVVIIAQMVALLSLRSPIIEWLIRIERAGERRRVRRNAVRTRYPELQDRSDVGPASETLLGAKRSEQDTVTPIIIPEMANSPTAEVNQKESWSVLHDDTLDRGRMIGFDEHRFKETLSSMSATQLRDASARANLYPSMDRAVKLEAVLQDCKVFGRLDGYYVKYRNRVFHYSMAEDVWTQVFSPNLPPDAFPTDSASLTTVVFEGLCDDDRQSCGAQFLNLAHEAVEPGEVVSLTATLPDNRRSSVSLHAARWAGLLIGLPLILHDRESSPTLEWHCNDYPSQVSLYAVTDDPSDPLDLCLETNWRNLPREITRRSETS